MENRKNIRRWKFIFLFLLVSILVTGCQYVKNPITTDAQTTPIYEPEGNGVIDNTPVPIPIASDSGEIEFTVLEIITKNDKEYAKVMVDRVLSYSKDENAYYNEIKEGDTIEFYLPFGSGEFDTKLNDITYGSVLIGLNKGDKLRGAIAGCPDKCNGGNGFGLFLYKVI